MSHSLQTPPRDVHVRRPGSDYTQAFIDLMPQGQAWPKRGESTLVETSEGLCEYWGFVDSRAADLLERESDPRLTIELLPDWERAFGLPDPCFPTATTIGQRHAMLLLQMTLLGAQSRAFFEWVANWLGYSITIEEYAPFMAGVSSAGDTRMLYDDTGDFRWYIGPPEMRFYWSIFVVGVELIWFRAASGEAGVDHHLEFGFPTEFICLLERWKPAHTVIVPDYTGIGPGTDPMAGTP
jgi:uncharacterized protein YmfQ (DUF2313 family)